jgi:hypothetical protein
MAAPTPSFVVTATSINTPAIDAPQSVFAVTQREPACATRRIFKAR